MPTVALLAGLVMSHRGPVAAWLAIALAWMAVWALLLRWLHDLELRLQTSVGAAAIAV